jgi:UrcA family protein
MQRLFTSFCFAAALLVASAASADPVTPTAVSVRTSDLDLSTEHGAERAMRRLERAADQVCGRQTAQTYPGTRPAYLSCRERTLSAAVAQLNAPLVAERYAQRRGAGDLALASR